MLKITSIIAKANGTPEDKIENLETVLKQQAVNGMTIGDALRGHCAGPASNPVFIDQAVSQLRNHDGVAATPNSPLMAVIHEEVDAPKTVQRPLTPTNKTDDAEVVEKK